MRSTQQGRAGKAAEPGASAIGRRNKQNERETAIERPLTVTSRRAGGQADRGTDRPVLSDRFPWTECAHGHHWLSDGCQSLYWGNNWQSPGPRAQLFVQLHLCYLIHPLSLSVHNVWAIGGLPNYAMGDATVGVSAASSTFCPPFFAQSYAYPDLVLLRARCPRPADSGSCGQRPIL